MTEVPTVLVWTVGVSFVGLVAVTGLSLYAWATAEARLAREAEREEATATNVLHIVAPDPARTAREVREGVAAKGRSDQLKDGARP